MGERGQLAGRVFGSVEVTTGVSTAGSGGDISLVVGAGDTGDGDDERLGAGRSTSAARTGGDVVVSAGASAWRRAHQEDRVPHPSWT